MLDTTKMQDIPAVRALAGLTSSPDELRAAPARKAAAKPADPGPQPLRVEAPKDAAVPAAPAPRPPSVTSNVGLVNGSFQVFIDLVDSANHYVIARIFGPPSQPQMASRAYAATAGARDATAKHSASV